MKIKHLSPTPAQRLVLTILSKGASILEDKVDEIGGKYVYSTTGETVHTLTVKALWHSHWIDKTDIGYQISRRGQEVVLNRNHRAHPKLRSGSVRYSTVGGKL